MPQLPPSAPLSWYLILSAILFVLGVAGFLFRRNVITVFMSIELMLNAVNLSFIAFSYQHGAASLLDFLNAQSDYRSVQVNYLNLVASYLNAVNQLNLAVGREVIP